MRDNLMKIEVQPRGSLNQREAAAYVGGLLLLQILEDDWGLRPWQQNQTRKHYRVAAIEEV